MSLLTGWLQPKENSRCVNDSSDFYVERVRISRRTLIGDIRLTLHTDVGKQMEIIVFSKFSAPTIAFLAF